MKHDWIEQAANGITSRWEQWEGEAGQISQVEQNIDAGARHLHECLVNYLRWMQANHSREEIQTVSPSLKG